MLNMVLNTKYVIIYIYSTKMSIISWRDERTESILHGGHENLQWERHQLLDYAFHKF
jgi:hypothetical protein